MKETIFFSFWRWGILSLSGADHMTARCWLADGQKIPPGTHLRCAVAGAKEL